MPLSEKQLAVNRAIHLPGRVTLQKDKKRKDPIFSMKTNNIRNKQIPFDP